jgi:Zn-dependent M28 family amino/carboxypeptidase
MINFDMVGRMRNNELFVAGLDSAPELRSSTENAAQAEGLTLKPITDYPFNMSYHGTFLDAGVPSVLFFTGLHPEYHTARDTADRLNPEGARSMLAVAYETLLAMADGPQDIEYVPGKDPAIQRNLREIASPSNPFQQE